MTPDPNTEAAARSPAVWPRWGYVCIARCGRPPECFDDRRTMPRRCECGSEQAEAQWPHGRGVNDSTTPGV